MFDKYWTYFSGMDYHWIQFFPYWINIWRWPNGLGRAKFDFHFFALFVFLRVFHFSQISGETKRIQSNKLGKYAYNFSIWWVFAHIETSIMRISSPFSSASILDCRINFDCMQKSGWYSIKSIITVDKVRIGEDWAANDRKHTKMEHARNYNNINKR